MSERERMVGQSQKEFETYWSTVNPTERLKHAEYTKKITAYERECEKLWLEKKCE